MKRFLPLFLALALALGLSPRASAGTAPNGCLPTAVYNYTLQSYDEARELPLVNLRLNEEPVEGEMPGVILGGRTMAPLRLLAEGLGAQVDWVPDAAQVLVTREDDAILLTLGSATAWVNGQPRELPDGVPATTLFYNGQGYTMVPLRFFSEALECRVEWEQESYTASVVQNDYIAQRLEEYLKPLDTPKDPGRYLIALDAGHGGSASGAFYEDTAEKDLNLAIVKRLEALLRGLGCRTVLTRQGDEDVGLYERAWMANAAGADIFVSVHCNAAERAPDFQGLYVYHYPESAAGGALAQSIQAPACAFTGAVDRGTASANFVVLRETAMPAVLVETGFMTCHEELERLKDAAYQTGEAQGIAQGIIRYLNAQS